MSRGAGAGAVDKAAKVLHDEEFDSLLEKRAAVRVLEEKGAHFVHNVYRHDGDTHSSPRQRVWTVEGARGLPPDEEAVGAKVLRGGLYRILTNIQFNDDADKPQELIMAWPTFRLGVEYDKDPGARVAGSPSGVAPSGLFTERLAETEAIIDLVGKLIEIRQTGKAPAGSETMGDAIARMNAEWEATFRQMKEGMERRLRVASDTHAAELEAERAKRVPKPPAPEVPERPMAERIREGVEVATEIAGAVKDAKGLLEGIFGGNTDAAGA